MFLSKTKLKASELMEQAVSFLVAKYNQTAHVFTSASPFGQLLTVIANISELVFTYISHVAEELNIYTAQNAETIFGLARLTGHDAYRGGSAYGMIAIKLNTSTDLIDGDCLIIKNFTKFIIPETGATYFLNLPSEYVKLNVVDNEYINIPFIQGIIESQKFTSDGTALQSFNPIVKDMTDNDNVSVTVNGKDWKKVESLYDMPADDGTESGECFMVKSSVNVGLSIFFGNGDFGKIPPAGAVIEIFYIKTIGSEGNANTMSLTYNFTESGYNEYGNEVNLNEVLNVETVSPPMLGSDFESPEFTKMYAPKTSKAYVLATPDNYVSYLSKYNQYAFIYAYNTREDDNLYDDNVTYIKIIPNIKNKLSSNQDYFDLPVKEFTLDDEEKQSIYNALYNSGRMLVNSEVQIIDPKVKKFAINVVIRYFEHMNKASIRTDIRNIFNKYFLNINRNDIVPLSDLVALVEGIEGVDTCDVFYISEENENAIKNGYYYKTERVWKNLQYIENEIKVPVLYNEDPRLGFDDFGNLIIDGYSICIAKGGWEDRYGNYYTETPEDGQLGPINIFFVDKVEHNTYNQNMQRKLNTLLKNNY